MGYVKGDTILDCVLLRKSKLHLVSEKEKVICCNHFSNFDSKTIIQKNRFAALAKR